MAHGILTAARLRELLDYDQQAGVFTRKIQRRAFKPGAIAGHLHRTGYIRIGIDRRLYDAHRLVFLYVTGAFPSVAVDHINGDKSDNRFSNLRLSNAFLNQQNQHRAHSQSKSGILGVCQLRSGRWLAQLQANGALVFAQTFDSAAEAQAAYFAAKTIHHPHSLLAIEMAP